MIGYKKSPLGFYDWAYTGGCYKGGEDAYYEKAVVGETYDFSYIPIEVREDESYVLNVFNTANSAGGLIGTIGSVIAYVCLLIALGSMIAFGVFLLQAKKKF